MSQRPVMTGALVGRQSEIAILQQHVVEVMRGSGSTVLLGGEAGIGKSRLIRELRQLFERMPAQPEVARLVLVGQCYETDQTLPLAPLLDLLRTVLARRLDEEIESILGPDAADLVPLLPELAGTVAARPPVAALEPQQEKQRLFQVLLRVFHRLARDACLLVVIEDLHWSDDTSLEFLLHLANRLHNLPLLLVLSYRSDEIQPGLRRVLATLDRERRATDLELKRLTPDEVDRLLRAIFNQPQAIQPDFLHAIFELTDGNPFFIEEVVRALIALGDIFQTAGRWDRKDLTQLRIPRSIQDAVARRMDGLTTQAREVLQFAAVAGRVFDFAALEALTRYTEPQLLALMRELIDAQLVVEESAERFAFRHALTRQAVYSQLLVRERRSLHQAIGETLEDLYAEMPEARLGDLAYHFAAAGDWARTLDYAWHAGEHALRLYTPSAAVEHFSRALDAVNHLGSEPVAELYRQRAHAYATLGAFDAAQHDYQTALEIARDSGDRTAEWRGLLELGQLSAGLDYTRAGDYLNQALALARALDQPRLVADSLTQVGGWLINLEQPAEAETVLADALDVYTRLGDQHGVARTTDLLGTAADIRGDMLRMDQRYRQAAALFRSLDDRQGLSSVLATNCIRRGATGITETVVALSDVPVELAVAEAEEAEFLAAAIDWRAGEAYAKGDGASVLASVGRYGEALRRVSAGLELANDIEHREWMTATSYLLGAIYLDLLSFDRARPLLERASALGREGGSGHWLNMTTGELANLAIAERKPAEAAALLTSVDPKLPMSTLGQRRVWLARSRLALATGNASGTLDIVDRLYATAANFAGPADIPHLAWLQGCALQTLGKHELAEKALLAAREGAEARGMRPLLWRIHAALEPLYRSLDRKKDAVASADAAWTIVEELATELYDEELRDAFLHDTASFLPNRAAVADPYHAIPLTSRERDVAALLARGLSNREIAERLFVGERTIETHVGNILAKLGFRSRTQVATWAVETGLAEKIDTTT